MPSPGLGPGWSQSDALQVDAGPLTLVRHPAYTGIQFNSPVLYDTDAIRVDRWRGGLISELADDITAGQVGHAREAVAELLEAFDKSGHEA